MADQDPPARRTQHGSHLDAWGAIAADLSWDVPWTAVFLPDAHTGRWFAGGELNVAFNCLDRHLPQAADRAAVLWEGELGDRRSLTYAELHVEVCALASALQELGVGMGDRVALYLGLLPETVVTMLACARIGAVHAILPSPLPSEALAERLADTSPKVLVTQDGAWRRGAMLPLKARADEALAAVSSVEHAIVVRRTGVDVNWYEGDRWYHELVRTAAPGDGDVAAFPADHPLLLVHHTTRRGRPRGLVHRSGGFLAYASALHAHALTDDPAGVFWCAMEIAWLAAQSHGIYGPLSWGGTVVLSEGTLDTPSTQRTWQIIERNRVDSWLTSPAVIRRLRTWTQGAPPVEALRSLRTVATAGEPIEAQTARWLGELVMDGGRILDGWGQTELGGIVVVTPPSRAVQGVPDPRLDIVDRNGASLPNGEIGDLVLRAPWPATFLDVLHDPETASEYWDATGMFMTGDLAQRHADGTITVLGRTEPVISVSGQLVAATEIREVLVEHPDVDRAEIIARADPLTGQAVVACVMLRAGVAGDEAVAESLRQHVHELLGGLARPSAVVFLEWLPADIPRRRLHAALRMLCTDVAGHVVTVAAGHLYAALVVAAGDEAGSRSGLGHHGADSTTKGPG